MQINLVPEKLRRLEIPGRVEIVNGHGGLPLVKITHAVERGGNLSARRARRRLSEARRAAVDFHEREKFFAPGKPIRGGVPICFPWFGNRAGEPSHGLARITEWQLVKTAAAPDGTVTLTFALPQIPGREAWKNLRTEFIVTVADTLTMELIATNESAATTLEIENCLHTYFQVGDIGAVSLSGLQNAPFDDIASGANGARKAENDPALRITQETNRVYPDHAGVVEIRDEKLQAHHPRGKIQFPLHRRLESVDDTEIAGRF